MNWGVIVAGIVAIGFSLYYWYSGASDCVYATTMWSGWIILILGVNWGDK